MSKRQPSSGVVEHRYPDRACSAVGIFLVESLAYGLLQAWGVDGPPVPVREMIRNPLPIFERLSLLELRLGLYDATYRSLLNGSRLIAVDLDQSSAVQRMGMARELYVAFCRSARAVELCWPDRERPHLYGDLFARCLLMPAAWVRDVYRESNSLEELASCFGVSPSMAARRLQELNMELLD